MDEEMDDAFEGASWRYEFDLDYEFDAARYFDFGRPETQSEAREAELWFETAGSYPPSPLIAQIFNGEGATMKSLKILSDLDAVGCTTTIVYLNDDGGPDLSQVNRQIEDIPNIYSKSTSKACSSKSSTLMRPTVSQLAKQNRINGAKAVSRSGRPVIVKSEKSTDDPNDYPLQATKRQRLETGHFCKIDGVKQQTDFIHKVREKNIGPANCNAGPPRLKLTIPREPHLETARRAERFKAQRAKSGGAKLLPEGEMPTVPAYKAHPLNRKAPSLPLRQNSSPQLPKFKEFNLKTHDRAAKNSSGSSTETAENHIRRTHGDMLGARRLEQKVSDSLQLPNDAKRLEESRNRPCEFKARPLDKKVAAIFSSKGDIGIFRSTKREITIPKEFNLSSSKRCQQAPLAELFNKLSLASEGKRITALQATFLQPTHTASKDSKENIGKPVCC
ncbi:protein TPX2-like [Ananas comosus]|uniref:Protein TPX2-like n=1 Tax=Ananas comosus TaxID=4615 RepID=A0A6P5GEK0_ANACO|nr:protein TPX2-like [Ananas comosus]